MKPLAALLLTGVFADTTNLVAVSQQREFESVLPATVVTRHHQSPHMVTVTLEVDSSFRSLELPDEYVRLIIGTDEPMVRVYTVSDYRIVNGHVVIDIDIVLHEHGVAAAWANDCLPGDQVRIMEPGAMYAAPADVRHHILVSDITGLPALGRISRELKPDQSADIAVVLTDDGDRVQLPSVADVRIEWVSAADLPDVPGELIHAVRTRVHDNTPAGTYLWFAGEASASRDVRKFQRRELGWSHHQFSTCGYWQLDAERKAGAYQRYAEQIQTQARRARSLARDDAAYHDALEDIYESFGI